MTIHKMCSNKNCSMKNILQSSENFSKCNKNKTKLSSRCKLCLNEYHKGRRHLKKEYDRKFREIHKYGFQSEFTF